MNEEHHDIVSRLSRKLQKATSQNSKLRKYAQHTERCRVYRGFGWEKECTCGLDKLLNIKRQEPI